MPGGAGGRITGAAYLAFAWLSIEVSGTLLPLFGVHASAVRILVIIFAVGFVPVLVASWLFEFTLQGVKHDRDVDHGSVDSRERSKSLDRWVVVLLAIAVAYFLFDKLALGEHEEAIHWLELADFASKVACDTQRSCPIHQVHRLAPNRGEG